MSSIGPLGQYGVYLTLSAPTSKQTLYRLWDQRQTYAPTCLNIQGGVLPLDEAML